MIRFGLAFTLTIALLLPATPARAQEVSLEQMEDARDAYRVGSEAFQKGDFPAAEARFRRCYDLLHSPSLLYDLALSVERQRKWRAAADTFEAFLHDSRKVKDRRRLERHVAELRERALRQEELASVVRPVVRDQGAPTAPGNEVVHYADGEDRLLGFGEASVPQHADDGDRQPRRKRWWVWALVAGGAVVVVGAGVGVALAATHSSGAARTDLGDFGVGASPLVQF